MRCDLALVVLATSLAGATLGAQTVRGVVVDDSTKLPIHSVAITLVDAAGTEIPPGVRTDSSGEFTIHAGRPGTYRVKAARLGYRALTSDPVSMDVGQLVTVRLRMTTVAQQLVAVRVIEQRRLSASELMSATGFDLRQSKGLGNFLDAEALAELGVESARDILTARLRHVISETATESGGVLTMLQGVAGCSPEIYLDGLLLSGGGPQDTLTGRREYALSVLSMYPANSLHGIEVYRGSQVPPPSLGGFMGNEQAALGRRCGAVAVWTKNGATRLASTRTTATSGVQVIRGVVVDIDKDVRVPGVPVTLRSEGHGALADPVRSDSFGEFVIRTNRAGRLRLEAGASSASRAVTSAPFAVAPEEFILVNLFVSAQRIVATPLGIAARGRPEDFGIRDIGGYSYRSERGLVGTFIRLEDIQRAGAASLADLVRGIDGVAITGEPPADTITMRTPLPGSAQRCRPAYFIDGARVSAVDDKAVRALPMNRVYGIEVYRYPSEIPPVFADGADECGLIAIWTGN